MSKELILADEGAFQDACSRFVGKNVIYCLSSLMYDILHNAKASAKIFDVDYEDMFQWGCVEDWQTPVNDFIDDCGIGDIDNLETIANLVADWDDILLESNVQTIVEREDEDGCAYWTFEGRDEPRWDDEDDATLAAQEEALGAICGNIKAAITEDSEYRDIANEFDLDPEQHEVYEHWLVDRYFAARLEERGELIIYFNNMVIWGRCTTGQSICLDHVIRAMVRDLPEHHWVWDKS